MLCCLRETHSFLTCFSCRWLFAYNSILEETVRRRRNMWSWQVIKKHRDTCRKYKAAYKKKLTAKKVPADVAKTLEVIDNLMTMNYL